MIISPKSFVKVGQNLLGSNVQHETFIALTCSRNTKTTQKFNLKGRSQPIFYVNILHRVLLIIKRLLFKFRWPDLKPRTTATKETVQLPSHSRPHLIAVVGSILCFYYETRPTKDWPELYRKFISRKLLI